MTQATRSVAANVADDAFEFLAVQEHELPSDFRSVAASKLVASPLRAVRGDVVNTRLGDLN
jgi:hypothetical protein